MKLIETSLPGVVLFEPAVFGDERGFFFEAWNRERSAAFGLPLDVAQANVSRSARGVLRGLHHQWPNPQGKLVWVLEGEVFDVAVDIRRGSPHYGRHFGALLSASNHRMMYVPPGFAHGFQVTSEHATFCYLCTATYQREHDRALAWNDPDLAIEWPLAEAQLSAKDQAAPRLRDIPADQLPEY
jgi:dTDP-4-dehydrorhamnose 3,5-epimerase